MLKGVVRIDRDFSISATERERAALLLYTRIRVVLGVSGAHRRFRLTFS
jgi:hypothetical protein